MMNYSRSWFGAKINESSSGQLSGAMTARDSGPLKMKKATHVVWVTR